jgi:AraC-like DNA-binding protein
VRAQLDGKRYQVTNCFINGFNTAPIQLHLPRQQVLFGVVLQPLAVKKLLRVPAGEFSNQLIEVTLLDAAFQSLWHQLAEQATFEQRVSLLSGWMERRFSVAQRQEKRINQFLYAADQHTITVPALAQALCYSPRQLARKMAEATGLNTEEILVYKKYLHALHLMHHSQLSLTEIAHQSHFADQSHFSKTFKAYANMTPSQYLRQKNFLQGHLYESTPSAENLPG